MSFLAGAIGALGSAFGGGGQNNFKAAGGEEAGTYFNQAGTGLHSLAQQLQQQALGNGPNLANQLLQNATGQNVANQAALMAGQRGAASNVGLLARQAAQQGANIQQQAVGQAAQNRLQEQLQSQGLLANTLQAQGQLGAGVLNEANRINAGVSQQNAQRSGNILGGIGNAVGALAPQIGGLFKSSNNPQSENLFAGPDSTGGGTMLAAEGGMAQPQSQQPSWQLSFLSGSVPMRNAIPMAKGGLPFMPHDYTDGGHVQAMKEEEKAVKPGDSYSNDKIPAMLSENEIVIPRSVTQSANAPQAAAQFVSQVLAGKHRKSK